MARVSFIVFALFLAVTIGCAAPRVTARKLLQTASGDGPNRRVLITMAEQRSENAEMVSQNAAGLIAEAAESNDARSATPQGDDVAVRMASKQAARMLIAGDAGDRSSSSSSSSSDGNDALETSEGDSSVLSAGDAGDSSSSSSSASSGDGDDAFVTSEGDGSSSSSSSSSDGDAGEHRRMLYSRMMERRAARADAASQRQSERIQRTVRNTNAEVATSLGENVAARMAARTLN